jgi:hypothetical protein
MTQRSRFPRRAVVGAIVLVLSCFSLPAAAVRLAAISGPNSLVTFDSATPGTIRNTIVVTGLNGGESLVAIDLRPLNDILYAVTNQQRVVIIDTCSAVAIPVGAAFAVALVGTTFGFDFNPAVDRLRLVTDAEENFRFNPITATNVDGDTVAAGIQLDTTLTVAGTVAAAAYDRNDNDGATPTTLYVIDAAADELRTQGGIDANPSPNLGQIFTVGALNVDADTAAGFEIVGASDAYAMFNVGGSSRLYRLNLATGGATLLGTIGANGLTGLSAISLKGLFANGFEDLPPP